MTSEYHVPGQALSIGKPLPNNNVYVLQSSADGLRPLALGDSGVIWVGGMGLTKSSINIDGDEYKLDPFLADG